MFKIKNIFLLVFLTILSISNQIDCRGGTGGERSGISGTHSELRYGSDRGFKAARPTETSELIAVLSTNLNKVKEIVESGKVDLNSRIPGLPSSVFGIAIDRVIDFINLYPNALDTVEYLIQAGADVNAFSVYSVLGNETPLYQVVASNPENADLFLKLINLLLGYGAKIDDKILEKARTNKYEILQQDLGYNLNGKVIQILLHNQELLEKAETNPTENELMEAIGYNKPYIVKIIADKRPGLVSLEDIKLAKETSPFSVPMLTKAFKLQKFRESELGRKLPVELSNIVEKHARYSVE